MTAKNTKTKTFESSKNKSSWGGKRPGAGRARGSKNKKTIEQEVAMQEMRDRIIRSKDELLNSQMNLAMGVQMLYKIITDKDGNRHKPELVTSQEEIESYLAGEYDSFTEYYFITTERPDNKAIDSLFDRVFGKATQPVAGSGEDGEIIVKIEKGFSL